MGTVRKSKSYFHSSSLPRGIEYDRFMLKNRPSELVFKRLFDAVPFINDAADTAQLEEAGHIRIATDQEVVDRKTFEDYGDGHRRAVQPHQIPVVTETTFDIATENGLSIKKTIVSPTEDLYTLAPIVLYDNVSYANFLADCVFGSYPNGGVASNLTRILRIPKEYLSTNCFIKIESFLCASAFESAPGSPLPNRVYHSISYSGGGGVPTGFHNQIPLKEGVGPNVEDTWLKLTTYVEIRNGAIATITIDEYNTGQYLSKDFNCCYYAGAGFVDLTKDWLVTVGSYLIQPSTGSNMIKYGRSIISISKSIRPVIT